MASSDQNIQPTGRAGSDRSQSQGGRQGSYQGTVTATREENGVQTLEVQSSQGRMRLQADGDFSVGDHIRLLFAPGGGVTVEKAQVPAATDDWMEVGYTLPDNMSALTDLRAFEEQLAGWIAGRNPGSAQGNPAGGAPGASAGGETEMLLRLPLPELLKRALVRDGGRDFLAQAVAGLDAGAYASLLAGLEEAKSEPGMASLLELVKNLRRGADAGLLYDPARTGSPADAQSLGGKAGALLLGGNAYATSAQGPAAEPMDAYWQAEAGAGAAPWFGRVVAKEEDPAAFSTLNRLQGNWNAPKDAPMFRYLLDLGGGTPDSPHTLTAYSAQDRQPGDFVDFELEKGPRLSARFLDPAETLPPAAKAVFASAPDALRPALQVAAHYLQDFRDEPYFASLVKDFAEVLAQSGRIDASTAAAARPAAQDPAQAADAPAAPTANPAAGALAAMMADPKSAVPAAMPDQKELDGLLRLFLAFPRDAAQPAAQAKVWGDAVRNPQALQELLKSLRPDEDASLLRAATPLHMADPAAGAKPGDDPVAAWLRKLLPEAFRSQDVYQAAHDADAKAAATSPEARDAAKFLLQAFSGAVPREQELRENHPAPFYFYQNQEWRNLQVTWRKDPDSQGRGKAGPKPPVQVRVETQAKHLGKVDVKVTLDDKGNAKLDFRNQFHDVREMLSQAIPDLERNLAFMDFHVQGWTYDALKDDGAAQQVPGWTRPASLDRNLDLFG